MCWHQPLNANGVLSSESLQFNATSKIIGIKNYNEEINTPPPNQPWTAGPLFSSCCSTKSVVWVKALHVRDTNELTRPNHTFRNRSGAQPSVGLLVVKGCNEQAWVIHTPLVIRMARCLVKGQGHSCGDVHPPLLQCVLQRTPVFDPCISGCLWLHHRKLTMAGIVRRHLKDIDQGCQAVVHISRIGRPNAGIQTAQHKPQCGMSRVTENQNHLVC